MIAMGPPDPSNMQEQFEGLQLEFQRHREASKFIKEFMTGLSVEPNTPLEPSERDMETATRLIVQIAEEESRVLRVVLERELADFFGTFSKDYQIALYMSVKKKVLVFFEALGKSLSERLQKVNGQVLSELHAQIEGRRKDLLILERNLKRQEDDLSLIQMQAADVFRFANRNCLAIRRPSSAEWCFVKAARVAFKIPMQELRMSPPHMVYQAGEIVTSKFNELSN
jgi:hypothetical protein